MDEVIDLDLSTEELEKLARKVMEECMRVISEKIDREIRGQNG